MLYPTELRGLNELARSCSALCIGDHGDRSKRGGHRSRPSLEGHAGIAILVREE
jgi:hypothetical protein